MGAVSSHEPGLDFGRDLGLVGVGARADTSHTRAADCGASC